MQLTLPWLLHLTLADPFCLNETHSCKASVMNLGFTGLWLSSGKPAGCMFYEKVVTLMKTRRVITQTITMWNRKLDPGHAVRCLFSHYTSSQVSCIFQYGSSSVSLFKLLQRDKKRNVPLQRNVPFQRNIPLQRNVPFQREITLLRCMESFPLQHSPNPQHFLHALCATIN